MRKLFIFLTAILLSCSENQNNSKKNVKRVKSEDTPSYLLPFKPHNFNKTYSTNDFIKALKGTALDSNWIDSLFKGTGITSHEGSVYKGMYYSVYPLTKIKLKDGYLITLIKNVHVFDITQNEIYVALLDKYGKRLIDIEWLGDYASVVECSMNTSFKIENSTIISYFKTSCFDSYDEKTGKSYESIKVIKNEILYESNKLLTKRDSSEHIKEINTSHKSNL